MMSKRNLIALISIVFIGIHSVTAQSLKELEAQKRKAQERLEATQKLLDDTKKSRKGTENELQLITRTIKETNNLIFSINSEIDGLNRDISSLATERNALSRKLTVAKEEYANMVSKNFVFSRQFSPVLFIFSSKNFSQGMRRARYLLEISLYRRKQVEQIKKLNKSVADKEAVLQRYVSQKSQSLQQKEQQHKKLNLRKDEKNRLLSTYNQKEKEYSETIREEQQRQKKLNDLIRQKVAEENKKKAEMAKKAAEEKKRQDKNKAKAKTTEKTKTSVKASEKPVITEKEYKQYKEDRQLTGTFAKNKGGLPMPVESGLIHRRFGRQTNPLTNTIENNSGIYIVAPNGADARAVFEGTVFEVMYEPGSGYIVWVMHGSYSTVYAQLSIFYVKKGEKVKARQKIGRIAQKNNKSELNFYILNENASYENPENWLSH
ncbi:MAG: murein hydrolase activator EnvC family protein [Bacteroidota bacterium]|jgi:peptidase